MSSTTRTKQINSKSYEDCLKQGIPVGKIYGSDFIDGIIVQRYTYPPYPWNMKLLSFSNKILYKQSQKSTGRPYKKIKIKSISRKSRSKSKSKKNQRSKSRK